MNVDNEARIREILATVKPLAAEYYQITGKPLCVTGESLSISLLKCSASSSHQLAQLVTTLCAAMSESRSKVAPMARTPSPVSESRASSSTPHATQFCSFSWTMRP